MSRFSLGNLVEKAGGEILRVGGAAFIVYMPGLLAAPDLKSAGAFAVAGILAAIAALVKVAQVLVPRLTTASLGIPQPLAAWIDAFSRAALAAFLVSVYGWLTSPDFTNWRSIGIAAILGALATGFRAVQGAGTPGETPFPSKP